MSNYRLKKHYVITASFKENEEKEKQTNFDVGVSGNILMPKNENKNRNIMIKLNFHLGSEDERLHLMLETVSVFEADCDRGGIDDRDIQKECLPIALANLRKTVKMVTEAYGMPALDLPPFEGE